MRRSWPVLAVAVTLVVPVTALLVSAWVLGWKLQVVQSGSMEPTFPVGSLTVVEPIDPADVRMGTAIAFDSPLGGGSLVTHRVVAVFDQGGGLLFETKGDANLRPDGQLVGAAAIRGRVRWAVPVLGRLLSWALRAGPWLVIGVPLGLMALSEVLARRHPSPHGHGGPSPKVVPLCDRCGARLGASATRTG